MTTADVLSQKKSESVLGRGLSEMAQQNQKPPTNLTQNEVPKKSLTELEVEIKFHLGQMAGHAIEIGKLLIQAKSQVEHGDWQNWLIKNFNLGQSSANKFMKIAERFGTKSESIPNLGTTQLITMLALPEGEEEKFMAEKSAENNPVEDMTIKELKAEIKDYKEKLTAAEKLRDGYKTSSEIAESQLETLNDSIKKLSRELNVHDDEMTDAIDAIMQDSDSADAKAKVEFLKSRLIEVKTIPDPSLTSEKLQEAEEKIAELETELQELKNSPIDIATEYPADYETIKAELNAAKEKLKKLQATETEKKLQKFFDEMQILFGADNLQSAVENLAKNDESFNAKIIQINSFYIAVNNMYEIWQNKQVK